MNDQFRRNIQLFGIEGQKRLEQTRIGLAGYGGLGSHCGLQLAHFGTTHFVVADPDIVESSNLNRLVGAVPADALNSVKKVEVAKRTISSIAPRAQVALLPVDLSHPLAKSAFQNLDVVIGALDNDVARLALTEFCSENAITYVDLATDAGEHEDGRVWFGGRVVICDGNGCLSCLDLLDQRELARAAMTPGQRDADDRIYGVDRALLDVSGPMVVSVNGVVASLAMTEFMALVTGLREPVRYLVYRGDTGIVTRNVDAPRAGCYYCTRWNRPKTE